MNTNHASNLRKFCRWLRAHGDMWSHLTVSGIAVRTRGEEWQALWLSIVLSDSPAGPGVLSSPVVKEDDIMAFRVDADSTRIRQILRYAIRGTIPAGELPGIPLEMRVALPTSNSESGYLSFSERNSVSYTAREAAGGWPCGVLQMDNGSLIDWKDGHQERHARLSKAERLFVVNYPGTLAELARRLGPARDGGNAIWDARAGVLIVAPLLAKIHSMAYDRDADVLRVQVKFGRLVRRGRFKLVVGWATNSRSADIRGFGGSEGIEEICLSQPTPGPATVALFLDGFGDVETQTYEVRSPHKLWIASVAVSLVDPNHERLRMDLQSANADEFERGVTMLFSLLGYSAFWWTRKLSGPSGVNKGMNLDVVLVREDQDDVLVVECTTDQCSDAKVNKLHGRAQKVRGSIDQSFEKNTIKVRALLCISQPREQIAPSVTGAVKTNHGGLISQSDALELLEMVARGDSRQEVMQRFERLFYSDEPNSMFAELGYQF